MDNPLYRENLDSELEEPNGNNTVESMTMFDRVFKKESFCTKYRSFLCVVGGLLVGCFVTVGFCYLFFNLGNKQNCRNVQSSVSASKQDDNQISRMIEDVNKTKEDLMVIHDMRKELVDYLTDIKNTTRKELLIVKTSFDSTLHLLNEIRKTSEQELSKINETRNIAWEFYAEFRNKSKTEQLSKMQSTNQFLEFRTEMRNMNFNETRIIQQWRNESKVQYREFRRKSQQDLISY
ncbi:unnamed protein product [Mytilus edulis]|uniref:Uncharacterized protein n=1 Tax=Mytilus edulis TaxID=6550 RepID=A0A8S3QHI9_MYTED|nr:unnamed protein product [Mytilus edulis]